jgi:pyruvate/2-oxoglutarate dehydrogenase complex dihydrolipoamide acyltransferase (E2) component
LTFTPILIEAIAKALLEFPMIKKAFGFNTENGIFLYIQLSRVY